MGYRKGEGWDRKEGLLNDNSGKNLLSCVSQSFFSGKHATTYKYCFLKSLLDNLYSFDKDYSIGFSKLGETFVSIYWNMIAVYHIPQMPTYSTGERTIFEKIIEKMISDKPYLNGVHFESIKEEDRAEYIYQMRKEGKEGYKTKTGQDKFKIIDIKVPVPKSLQANAYLLEKGYGNKWALDYQRLALAEKKLENGETWEDENDDDSDDENNGD